MVSDPHRPYPDARFDHVLYDNPTFGLDMRRVRELPLNVDSCERMWSEGLALHASLNDETQIVDRQPSVV